MSFRTERSLVAFTKLISIRISTRGQERLFGLDFADFVCVLNGNCVHISILFLVKIVDMIYSNQKLC